MIDIRATRSRAESAKQLGKLLSKQAAPQAKRKSRFNLTAATNESALNAFFRARQNTKVNF